MHVRFTKGNDSIRDKFWYVSILSWLPFVSTEPWSVGVAERLALPTSDHGVAGSNPAGGEILPEP